MSRLLFLILSIFSLQANASSCLTAKDTLPDLTREDYHQMSKHQLTTAIVIVSVGGAAFAGGAFLVLTQLAEEETSSLIFGDSGEKDPIPAGYYIAMIGGAILALCSIPIFASAKKNRRLSKTATVGINIENLNGAPNIGVAKSYFPAISLRLRF